jgi:hypothetical protein
MSMSFREKRIPLADREYLRYMIDYYESRQEEAASCLEYYRACLKEREGHGAVVESRLEQAPEGDGHEEGLAPAGSEVDGEQGAQGMDADGRESLGG